MSRPLSLSKKPGFLEVQNVTNLKNDFIPTGKKKERVKNKFLRDLVFLHAIRRRSKNVCKYIKNIEQGLHLRYIELTVNALIRGGGGGLIYFQAF